VNAVNKFWYELSLRADDVTREILASGFMTDCLGAIDAEQQTRYFFDSEARPKVESYLLESSERFSFEYSWEKQGAEPWHLAWKDHFKPVTVGRRICIVPDWDETTRAEIRIRIKPGMAFGTGHHETTFLMLEALLAYCRPGTTVLDVGSGSGILAIAARKLGAAAVNCVEYDDACRENFHENLALNNINAGVELQIADILQWSDFKQDLILANVNARVIKALLPRLAGCRQTIVLSGLLGTDEPSIRTLCEQFQLNPVKTVHRGEWIRMDLNL